MKAWDWASVIAAFLVIVVFLRIVWSEHRDDPRHAEDAARRYFETHGRWPDEE